MWEEEEEGGGGGNRKGRGEGWGGGGGQEEEEKEKKTRRKRGGKQKGPATKDFVMTQPRAGLGPLATSESLSFGDLFLSVYALYFIH